MLLIIKCLPPIHHLHCHTTALLVTAQSFTPEWTKYRIRERESLLRILPENPPVRTMTVTSPVNIFFRFKIGNWLISQIPAGQETRTLLSPGVMMYGQSSLGCSIAEGGWDDCIPLAARSRYIKLKTLIPITQCTSPRSVRLTVRQYGQFSLYEVSKFSCFNKFAGKSRDNYYYLQRRVYKRCHHHKQSSSLMFSKEKFFLVWIFLLFSTNEDEK